ncbi:hypothetical protein ACIA5D_17360 [Actinoplanes sp. NPDC051513]|uniref:hypothetical protein n=1 Tax=Actinoplanes sp. NPDC051513 TaxID=3363908 RepID=UPI0037B2879B
MVVGTAFFVVLLFSRYRMVEIIIGDLARGRPPAVRRPEAREIEQRLQVIEAAQGGNILLHAGFEPFVGAGERVNAWSIATELRSVESPGRHGEGPSRRVDIDPVALTAHVRRRLAEMRSRDLPQSTRVVGLQLRDQIASSGTRWHDYPLIDERVRLPYSFAEPATVDAIIRAPQTSARHFLRAGVGAPDRAAVGADGRAIMPAEHQSVVTSTFIHIAVEGGMLYVELVASVLGPIRQRYLDIDRYSAADDQLTAAAGEAIRRLSGDVAVAPARLVRSIYRRLTLVGAITGPTGKCAASRSTTSAPGWTYGSWRAGWTSPTTSSGWTRRSTPG